MTASTETAEQIIERRGLPSNPDAERTILGSILLENAQFYECAGLAEACFSLNAHRLTFRRMGEMITSGSAVDIVTLGEELARRKEVGAVGGIAWLASLTEGLPRRLNVGGYIRIVRDKWAARRVIEICSDGITRAADQSETAGDVIADLDYQLLGTVASAESERPLREQNASAWDEIEDLRRGKRETGVGTTIRQLDAIIGGYKRRKLYVVGGRPSMGKTSLMIGAAIQHCARKIRTRLVSIEMEAEELLQRVYAAVAEVPYQRVMDPASLSDFEWAQLRSARTIVDGWPLEIDSRAGQTIDAALAGCRLSCRRRATGFVALDYLQILRFSGDQKLRYQELSDATAKLREFAKVENIPVMLLSSLTETGDRDPNRRPNLSSLRGSGDLGFHADVAMLIHRERGEDGATILDDGELIVAKQRGGRTGVAYAKYNTANLLFEDRQASGRENGNGQ